MKKLKFTNNNAMKLLKDNKIFNFLNLESLWHYKNNPLYSKLISQEHNINFPDGRLIGLRLRTKQQRGPAFTKKFLTSKENLDKKHFFIGDTSVKELSNMTGIVEKNLHVHNPPYIKDSQFSKKEREKIINMFKKFKPDYVWVCVGAPKQEILSNQLYEHYPICYFNVGAALDFLLDKKRESPRFVRKLGIEWLYRLMMDFKHSKKKVWRHFGGLRQLRKVELR